MTNNIKGDKMKMKTIQVVSVDAWNKLVKDTYGKPYNFQQQDGCKGRGPRGLY